MQQTTHCTGVMHTAMIQQELKAGCCQNSVEYWKMYRYVCTMYIHICKFLFMYIKWTGITSLYRHVCTITYLYVHGKNMYIPCIYAGFTFLYRYKHVCTWFRHICTVLPNPVQVVRIPDVKKKIRVNPYIYVRIYTLMY
jgi:hypothetical protein